MCVCGGIHIFQGSYVISTLEHVGERCEDMF